MSTQTRSVHRPARATRRFGYGVAGAINFVFLYLINRRPGWSALPFLTERTTEVILWVNASLVTGLAVCLVQIVRDPRWLVALGSIATTAVGSAATIRMWQVFPFDFGDTSFNWPLVARVALGVGVLGSAIALVVHTVSLAGALRGRERRPG